MNDLDADLFVRRLLKSCLTIQCVDRENKINNVRDSTFECFSRKAGVANIREYEESIEEDVMQRERHLSSLKRKRAELHTEADRLNSTLSELNTKLDRLSHHKEV